MDKKVIIAPSVLSCDFLNLGREIERLNVSGAEWVHYDVMDGKFVPEISYGEVILRKMKEKLSIPLDVHLMTVEPLKSIGSFARSGADRITVHYEACSDLKAVIDEIHAFDLPAAVAIRPDTPVEVVYPYLHELQMVLIMTVNPGFGGQPFIPESIERIRELRRKVDLEKLDMDIQVDGGINMNTVQEAYHAGANVFVSGSALFKGDLMENVRRMKSVL